MTEGFWDGLYRHLIFWAGWVFTVGGAAASLWVGKEYAWIGALVLLTGVIALTAFAFQKHKDLKQAQEEHQAATSRLETELRALRERAEIAERRLNEVPANILVQLEATIRAHEFQALADVLGSHADYVARMTNLAGTVARPITLRTFVKRAGRLFVEAKLDPAALSQLRQDDPFRLEFKSPSGLVTPSALLHVHQLDPSKELVWFHVAYPGGEMAQIDALAEKQEVPGKGYTARPLCDPSRYANLDLTGVAAIIRTLTDEIAQLRD